MPLILNTTASPGTAAWTEFSTIATAAAIPGTVQFVSRRIQVADLTDAAGSQQFLLDAIPALSGIIGASVYVETAASGGGSAAATVTVQDPATGDTFIELQDVFGATPGEFIPVLNANPSGFSASSMINVWQDARTLVLTVAADVNVDTLTTFDVRVFVFYVTPGLTIP